jgi:2,3-bisphosphoglycerate-independent phosphoglycerate mutase
MRPVVLCILDGWGYREDSIDNAIKLANTPFYDALWTSTPRAWLKTSGLAVGLPDGQMGNSEVGHTNLGGGRVVLQDLPRIDRAIADGSLPNNKELLTFIDALKTSGGTAHIMGLVSPGGVHSHQDHIAALAKTCAEAGVPVVLHGFLDGRDTPPRSAETYITKLEDAIANLTHVSIATISGRYFAMDRDNRWDRVKKAYDAIRHGKGINSSDNSISAIKASYDNDIFDEFVEPTTIANYAGMQDGDGLLMANFRADRAREILTAFVDPIFDGFDRGETVQLASVLGVSEYSIALNEFMGVMFPSIEIQKSYGEVISAAGLKQLRISETEKYAHITFFFNGGKEDVFAGEERILVPSPRVATYDLQPEMSAPEVTEKLVAAIKSGEFATIIVNYANPDMVGHTGILSAAIEAVECIDRCIAQVSKAVRDMHGALLICADHGNVELMKDQNTGEAHTAHTNFDVPILLVSDAIKNIDLNDGCLADVAPTMLELLELPQPAEMTGTSLLKRSEIAEQ